MMSLKTEIQRKLFHGFALIYIVGLFVIPRPIYLAVLGMALILVLMIEWGRLRKGAFQEWFLKYWGFLLRDKEKARLTGAFWMLLGVFLSVFLLESPMLITAALLYLVIGDAAASLVGKKIGGKKWPKSDKSISGSGACFLTCVLIGFFTVVPNYGWTLSILGSLMATLMELISGKCDDNLMIPLGTSIFFAFWI